MPSSEVPKKWKAGQLHMGGSGKVVPKDRPDIMKAILMSEKKNEAEHGGHYVSGGERRRPRRKK